MEQVVTTYCGICEKTCGMQVTVSDNMVQNVEGFKDHLRSRGDLCVKGRAARDILYAPDRLKTPMKKVAGQWVAISWEEALKIISRTLNDVKAKHGANSLSVYHGQTYLKNCVAMFSMKRFMSLVRIGKPVLCRKRMLYTAAFKRHYHLRQPAHGGY